MLRFFLIHTVIFFMNGCGGGGTSVEPEPLKTLYFIDSPVNGIDFKCGNRTGVTEMKEINGTVRSGVLQCRKDTITFSLETLVLGSIESYKDGQEIRPQDLVDVPQDEIENENVLKIALLLQSLNDNQNDETILITEEIKKELKINNLTNSSIADIEEIIKNLGKTPKNLTEVKQHLIRNSSISYEDSKPVINSFEVEISTSSPAGFTIGTISINEGKSPLTSLTLSGEGAENFQLNNDGTLLLLKKLNNEKEYQLEVNAENIYGNVSQTISLEFKIMDKIGIAQLDGYLSDSTIKIIKLNTITNQEELVYTEKTSTIGTFNTHASELDNETFYILEASDGIEINNEANTTNKGTLRLISKGKWLKNANDIIRITPLSEMQYDYVVKYIKDTDIYNYSKIETILNESSRVLLNNGSVVNTGDILIFNPLINQSLLYNTIKNNSVYQTITNKIRMNDISYIKDLFNSSIISSFAKNEDFKVVGSFAYIYGNDYFYIYDIVNQKKLSEIYLPKKNADAVSDIFTAMGIPIENQTTVSLSLSLDKNHIFLSNLNNNLIIINITDLKNPSLVSRTLIGSGKHIVGEFKNMLFFSKGLVSIKDYEGASEGLLVKNTKVVDIEDINEPKILENENVPYFDKITTFENETVGHVFIKENCTETNTIDIKTYYLRDKNNISTSVLRQIPVKTCDVFTHIDDKNLIYLSYFQMDFLEIYGLTELFMAKYYKTIDYNTTPSVINRYENTLYIVGLTDISFINIEDPENAYIYNNMLVEYTHNNLSFQNNIFTTKQHIIDTKSYLLTSQYMALQEDFIEDENGNPIPFFTEANLNVELFKPFSN